MAEQSIAFLTVKEQAQLLRDRQLSPVELVELYLERIEQLDGHLNAYITVCRDEALQAARQAEGEILAGNYKGPLHGIPIPVKDQFYTAGVRTTGGSKLLSDFVSEEDATVIANMKRAGGILLGKLNLMEFAMGTTLNFPFGTPRNPWNLERTPGGSSSGSGSSVAAGLCSASLGEDTGGSIRAPASMCGITGIKPTWGRISRYGVLPLCWSQDCAGPMARTAEDCAIILRYLAGYDPKDPFSSQEPVPDYTEYLDGDLRGVRIGVVREMSGERLQPEMRQGVDTAVGVLGELGATVEQVSIPFLQEARFVYTGVADTEAASYHRKRLRNHYPDFDYNTRVRLMAAALIPSQMRELAARVRAALGRRITSALKQVDILVGATLEGGAPKIQTESNIHSKEDAWNALFGRARAGFTPAFSMAGTPALSMPCGFNSEGLPLGFQVVGRHFEEGLVFKVAHAYQQATDWHKRRPPVS